MCQRTFFLPLCCGKRLPWVLLGLLALPMPVRARDTLRDQLKVVALDIKKVLDEKGAKVVAIGTFTGPAASAASGGPGIAQRLREELQKLNVEVRNQADYGINGRYSAAIDKTSTEKSVAVALWVWIEDRGGNEIYRSKPQGILGDAEILALLGLTGTMPVDIRDSQGGEDRLLKERNNALKAMIQNPKKPTIVDGRVLDQSDSPFAIEVLVEGRQRSAEDRDGLAFAPIKRDEVYAVRLTNNADFETSIRLFVDGLSMFTFSEARDKNGDPRYNFIIVPPHQSVIIPGWHVNNSKSDSFQVVAYSESAVAKQLKSSAAVGTITAEFSACWEKDKDPPADESRFFAQAKAAEATGRGPRVDKEYTEVERTYGRLRASISIRYTKP